jgi:ABC-type transporter Mla subunit MlaD
MPYRKMKLYVGLFVSFLVVGVILLFALIMDKKGYFDDYNSYYFKTQFANNFYVGMPLNVSGFEIGDISNLILMDNGEVKVFFRVKERNQKWICKDTYLMLDKPLIGSPSISVHTTLKTDKLKNDQELEIIIRDDINDLIVKLQPILNEVEQIIHSVNIISQNFASEDGPLEKSLRNVEKLSEKLANSDALLTTVTGDANATAALNDSLIQTKEIFSDIKNLTQELNTMLKMVEDKILSPAGKSIEGVDVIFKDIEKKLKKLDGVVDTVGSYDKELLLLKKELHINLDKTHQLLDKVDAMLLDKSADTVVLP